MPTELQHTCILDDGGTAGRRFDACEAEPKAIVDETVTVPSYVEPEDAVAALDEAKALKLVADASDYEYAADLTKRLSAAAKGIRAYFKPFKQALDRLKDRVLDAEARANVYDDETRRVARLAADWNARQKQIEREAQEKAEREARAKAETERQAQVARLKAAAEAVPDPAVAAAVRLESEQLAAAKVATPKVDLPSRIPAVKGFVPNRETWSGEVTDLMALVKAVAAGTVPLDAIVPNYPRINQAARDQHEALNWPGVEVRKNGAPVVRTT